MFLLKMMSFVIGVLNLKPISNTRPCLLSSAFQKCVIENLPSPYANFHYEMLNPMTIVFDSPKIKTNVHIWNKFSVLHSYYKGENFKRKKTQQNNHGFLEFSKSLS